MLDDLNPQQRAAACYDGDARNLLVVAGAGCGKTKTMVSRVHYLLTTQQVPANRILCLTFTNRAANQMVARIRSQSRIDADDLTACTFHSFCIQLIRRVPKSFGFEIMPTIIDAGNQKILMSDSLSSAQEIIQIDEEEKALVPKVDALLREYSYARNAMRPVRQQFADYLTGDEKMLALAESAVAHYEDQKTQYGYVDFDDILYRFVEVAEQKPDLAEAISNLFAEVLIDEMQDTNPVQYRILKLLGAGQARLFAVGDPAQSIYGFRGADFESIYRFTELFPNSECLYLSTNYRSGQEILDVANRLLAGSAYTYDNALSADKGATGRKVRLCDFANGMEEGTFVAREIVKHFEGGGKFADYFIITRSAFSAREVEGALRRFNVPYEFVGGMSINKTAHVQDLLSALKLIRNPRDKLSCIRFLSLFPGVGAKTAARAYRQIVDAEGHEAIATIIAATVRKEPELASGIYRAMAEAVEQGGNPIHTALSRGFETLIQMAYPERYEYRLTDLKTVGDIYRQYQGDLDTFIADFTLEPEMNKVEASADDEDDKVTIITAHSAKGLERKKSVVIGAIPGVFPSKRSIGKLESEEEERRVMYVAMTRAQEELIITRNMEYAHHFFANAVTDVDFVKGVMPLLDRTKQRSNGQQVGGLAGLADIF